MRRSVLTVALGILTLVGFSAMAKTVQLGTTYITNSERGTGLNVPNTCGVNKIALRVHGDRTRIDAIIVDYVANGAQETTIPVNAVVTNGQTTGWIDLPGRVRCLDKVVVIGRSLGSPRPSLVDVLANRPENNGRLLGQTHLSENNQFQYINVRNLCGLSSVRLHVLNDRAQIDYVAVRFVGTGNYQQIPVRRAFAPNTFSLWKDLNGNKRCIDSFYVYGRSGQRPRNAIIQLWGR